MSCVSCTCMRHFGCRYLVQSLCDLYFFLAIGSVGTGCICDDYPTVVHFPSNMSSHPLWTRARLGWFFVECYGAYELLSPSKSVHSLGLETHPGEVGWASESNLDFLFSIFKPRFDTKFRIQKSIWECLGFVKMHFQLLSQAIWLSCLFIHPSVSADKFSDYSVSNVSLAAVSITGSGFLTRRQLEQGQCAEGQECWDKSCCSKRWASSLRHLTRIINPLLMAYSGWVNISESNRGSFALTNA